MKKLCFLSLLALLFVCLCSTAFATTISNQQLIADVTDANGPVTQLTDDDTATAWTKSGMDEVDLTIVLYSNATVGEIWLRSGYAYTQNWYNHYDRPDIVKVTVYYGPSQYTQSSDTYRYRLIDSYQPNTLSETWNNGYQRLLLPKRYSNVTKIELTIESSITGYGNTGTTISDIIVAAGNHVIGSGQAYATATPKPYVVYVTPTPAPDSYTNPPSVQVITPAPTATPTPELTDIPTSAPTAAPELTDIPAPTAVPTPTQVPTEAPTRAPITYPTIVGTPATLLQRIATRTGPSNYYDEPGSFFSAGDEVKVITKAWDAENEIWWFQVEFYSDYEWYRAYTPAYRVDLNPDYVATETTTPFTTIMAEDTWVYYGPSTEFKKFAYSVAYTGYEVKVYNVENDWAQIEYYDYATGANRRGWVPVSSLAEQPY